MPRAVVKWFDPAKNFGFLTIADGPEMGTEVFVHGQDVVGNPLRDYDAVNCELQVDVRNGRYRAASITGGTGVMGDMTRPPKIRIGEGAGPGLTAGAVDASGNAPMDPAIEALRPRKDSRCNHVSFADLREEVIRRRRRKQRRRDRGEASSSDEGRGRNHSRDRGRDRGGDYDRRGDRGGGRRY